MKTSTLFMLVLTAILGALLGTLIVADTGYVLIAYGDYVLETTLWLAIVALILAYLLARLTFVIVNRMLSGSGTMGSWNRERRARSARQQTIRGLLLMAEGQWLDARKLLLGAVERVETPLINFLNAARASHELGELDQRDALLNSAHESTPGARFAVALTQAQLQMAKAQWEQCLATLLQLRSESPRHPLVLDMLMQCYRQVGDWQAMVELLPALKKQKVLSADQALDLAEESWCNILSSTHERGEDLGSVFAGLSKELRRRPALIERCARLMCAQDQYSQAEEVVRRGLAQTWNDDLVKRYGCIVTGDPKHQLVVAQGWLKERPNDANLLLCLGRVSMMNQAFSEAVEYFEASLALGRSSEVQSELGRLCIAMGDYARGSVYLSASLEQLPDLPLPVAESNMNRETA